MRKDSKLFLRKLLDYRKQFGRDNFEINYKCFEEIPSIETAIFDILEDLINCNCLTSRSQVIDLEGDISINLTFDGIIYFDEGKSEEVSKENNPQYVFNVPNGQINIANDNGIINVAQNNSSNVYQKIESRTKEYADKWNANMFLNDFNKRDENAGVNVKLSEVYLEKHLPHYKWKNNKNPKNDLKDLLSEYVIEKGKNKMLLILGQPGIGKSTLITWITANFLAKANEILVYKVASDLKNVDWQNADKNYNIADDIMKKIGMLNHTLDGKTLILDGFDEISVRSRIGILNKLLMQFIKNSSFNDFSLIITCRENYFWRLDESNFDYITLQSWDDMQIESFCSIFQEKTKRRISYYTIENVLKNKSILGIPLILYMVLALNISIEKEGSIVDVYDKIFSLDGGIYDRCINSKSFAEPHRTTEIKRQIHQISREIAIWMFENKPDEAYITQQEYHKICINVMQESERDNEDIKKDFLIGNFFKLVRHCEGVDTEKLFFVHRSIYEYFVIEIIYKSMEQLLKGCDIKKDQKDLVKKIANIYGRYLKGNELSVNMLDFLRLKIRNSILYREFDTVNKVFQLMLRDGMLYYTGECYKNVIECEMKVFANMLEIIHLWDWKCLKIESNIDYYIRCNEKNRINLSKMNLKKMNLKGADLCNANLRGANLEEVDLSYADLERADLKGVNLSNTNLKGVNLRDADLSDSKLIRTNLSDAVMKGVNLRNANLHIANLRDADLSKTNSGDADLSGAYLIGAYLRNAKLLNTNLHGAIIDENQANYLRKKIDLKGICIYDSTNKEFKLNDLSCLN